jgi:hypothetical protein
LANARGKYQRAKIFSKVDLRGLGQPLVDLRGLGQPLVDLRGLGQPLVD